MMSNIRIQNNVLFPDIKVEKKISIESRRYIGNKAKLTNWIFKNILNETKDSKIFFDVFAGTAIVTKTAFNFFNYRFVVVEKRSCYRTAESYA